MLNKKDHYLSILHIQKLNSLFQIDTFLAVLKCKIWYKSPCWQRVGDSRWWGSLTMVSAENKSKCLSSVNHTTKTIHHHHPSFHFLYIITLCLVTMKSSNSKFYVSRTMQWHLLALHEINKSYYKTFYMYIRVSEYKSKGSLCSCTKRLQFFFKHLHKKTWSRNQFSLD